MYPRISKDDVTIIEKSDEEEEPKKKSLISRIITPLIIPTSPKNDQLDIKSKDKLPIIKKSTKSIGERLCCEYFSNKFSVDFKTHRPDFLKNPRTGKNLELDCFNPDLYISYKGKDGKRKVSRLAIEYNGIQHYKWPNFTGQTQDEFVNQQYRDRLKISLCEKEDIYLIIVPYDIHHDMIPTFIEDKLPEDFEIFIV